MTQRRLHDDLGIRHQGGRLRMPVGAEAEDGRRPAEGLGEVGQRRHADAAADEQGLADEELEAHAERAQHVELVPLLQRTEGARSWPDRIDEERGSPSGTRQTLIGRGSSRPGTPSMKNCPGMPTLSGPRSRRAACTGRPPRCR